MTKADDALDEAVRAVVTEMRTRTDGQEDTGVVTAWATVVHTASFGDDGTPQSAYYILFSGGSVPDHVAVGLFDHGIHMVRNGEAVNEDR